MIDDIINEHAQAVIVVESPHRTEIKTGIPLSGESGKVVSGALLNLDTPIGPLCDSGHVPLAIVNTFSQPRQFDIEGQARPALLRVLNDLRYKGLIQYKRDIHRILDASRDEHLLRVYERRIAKALEVASIKKLVICGTIAQAVFEWVFGIRNSQFLRPFNCSVGHYSVEVFYIWHPSPESGDEVSAWEMPENAQYIAALREFVGPISSGPTK